MVRRFVWLNLVMVMVVGLGPSGLYADDTADTTTDKLGDLNKSITLLQKQNEKMDLKIQLDNKRDQLFASAGSKNPIRALRLRGISGDKARVHVGGIPQYFSAGDNIIGDWFVFSVQPRTVRLVSLDVNNLGTTRTLRIQPPENPDDDSEAPSRRMRNPRPQQTPPAESQSVQNGQSGESGSSSTSN